MIGISLVLLVIFVGGLTLTLKGIFAMKIERGHYVDSDLHAVIVRNWIAIHNARSSNSYCVSDLSEAFEQQDELMAQLQAQSKVKSNANAAGKPQQAFLRAV
jgi:hypothetical protein